MAKVFKKVGVMTGVNVMGGGCSFTGRGDFTGTLYGVGESALGAFFEGKDNMSGSILRRGWGRSQSTEVNFTVGAFSQG